MANTYAIKIPSVSGITSSNPFLQLYAKTAHALTILGIQLGQEASVGSAQACLIARRRSAGCTMPNKGIVEPVVDGGASANCDPANDGFNDFAHCGYGLATALAGSTTKLALHKPFNVLQGIDLWFPTAAQITVAAASWLTLEFLAAPPSGLIWSGQVVVSEA